MYWTDFVLISTKLVFKAVTDVPQVVLNNLNNKPIFSLKAQFFLLILVSTFAKLYCGLHMET